MITLFPVKFCKRISSGKTKFFHKNDSWYESPGCPLEVQIEFRKIDVDWLIEPGGRLNKKDGLTRYGDSHVKDKTS